MTRVAEQELRHIVQRVESGYITAARATKLAVIQGYLAIGTAIPKDVYVPDITLIAGDEEGLSGWHPLFVNERGGASPTVLAGKVPQAAVWGAFGGDANEVFQRSRVGRPILPEDKIYDLGTYGWAYDKQNDLFVLYGHHDLVQAGRLGSAEEVVGAIDFVLDDGSFDVRLPSDPGHFGSMLEHETVATIPVRYGDVQAVLDNVLTGLHNYIPLQR